ncbi:hypothetical protein HK104_010787 [Borealophlyctis nickersoniae]|nr:hypothetical protein HK104_010787 [Borealophlyctis nickersoniae]
MSYRDSMYTDSTYRDSMVSEFDNDVLAEHFAGGADVQSSILAALNHMGANVAQPVVGADGGVENGDGEAGVEADVESSEGDFGTIRRV